MPPKPKMNSGVLPMCSVWKFTLPALSWHAMYRYGIVMYSVLSPFLRLASFSKTSDKSEGLLLCAWNIAEYKSRCHFSRCEISRFVSPKNESSFPCFHLSRMPGAEVPSMRRMKLLGLLVSYSKNSEAILLAKSKRCVSSSLPSITK